jgi:hypothetical protein
MFAPHLQVRPEALRALVHTRETPVSAAPRGIESLGIDADAVIPDPHIETLLTIDELDGDPAGTRVLDRIAHRLPGNAIGVVSYEWRERPGLTFYQNVIGRRLRGSLRQQLRPQRHERLGQITRRKRRGAQVLNGGASFGDGLVARLERAFQNQRRVGGASRQQFPHGVEAVHQALHTL